MELQRCETSREEQESGRYLYWGRAHPSIRNISPTAPPKDRLIKAARRTQTAGRSNALPTTPATALRLKAAADPPSPPAPARQSSPRGTGKGGGGRAGGPAGSPPPLPGLWPAPAALLAPPARGRTGGRTDGRTDGWMDEGRTDGGTKVLGGEGGSGFFGEGRGGSRVGWMDGRTRWTMDGRTDGQTGAGRSQLGRRPLRPSVRHPPPGSAMVMGGGSPPPFTPPPQKKI